MGWQTKVKCHTPKCQDSIPLIDWYPLTTGAKMDYTAFVSFVDDIHLLKQQCTLEETELPMRKFSYPPPPSSPSPLPLPPPSTSPLPPYEEEEEEEEASIRSSRNSSSSSSSSSSNGTSSSIS
ncbi:hypothetical protein HZH66_000180 [Vespula vulgaris]|uniref:Uncharacterized protein n=1 Tax=Vespula vulgaris TaxID=7454 RepID=A0A834KU07_VESVU|nr:hypothetical protein HZH66_000180 [Vespula vulgaris]